MGLLHTNCCKRLYFEKTFWIWFYNTFISFSLLNTDYQGSFLLPEISGPPIVLIASSGNIIWIQIKSHSKKKTTIHQTKAIVNVPVVPVNGDISVDVVHDSMEFTGVSSVNRKNNTNLSILKRSKETDGTYENDLIVSKLPL